MHDRCSPIGGPSFPTCEVEGCNATFYVAGSRDWHITKCVLHRMEEMRESSEFKKFFKRMRMEQESLGVGAAFAVLKALT